MNLPNSRDRAVSISTLAEFYGQSRRQIERELQRLVEEGQPIVASERGVYLETNPDLIDRYADILEARIGSQLVRVRALRKAAQERRQTLTLGLVA